MELSSALAVIALILAAGFLLLRDRRRPTAPDFGNTDELVQWLASEAKKDAREKSHIKLDYSVASIQNVEKTLARIHNEYTRNPSAISVNGLASAYGAYIGEVIRRNEPGTK